MGISWDMKNLIDVKSAGYSGFNKTENGWEHGRHGPFLACSG